MYEKIEKEKTGACTIIRGDWKFVGDEEEEDVDKRFGLRLQIREVRGR